MQMELEIEEDDGDVFKQEFKRFKRPSDDDMKNSVINLKNPDSCTDEIVRINISCNIDTTIDKSLGLIPHYDWEVYRLKSKPGLIFIKNPFLPGYQHQWIIKCLTNYPLLPNVCNMDSHMTRKGMGEVWPLEDKSILKDLKSFKDSLLYKLRWVTLGYHYNWTTKLYDPSDHSPFPKDLSCLSEYLLSIIGFKQFKAEAAIVNYYHMDSTLSGHTDHSEKDLSAPLTSISFGQSAIFLIGGHTKKEKPVALLLNSGDIVVMSAESRLAYHAVPKVIQSTHIDEIPRCLSIEQFQQALQDRETCSKNFCSLCGNNLAESMPQRSNSQCSTEGEVRRRKRTHSNVEGIMSDSKMAALLTDEEKLQDSPSLSKGVSCNGCTWILQNWDDFKFYLTHSRININIRQVGVLTD